MQEKFTTIKKMLIVGAVAFPLSSIFAQKAEITSKKDKFGLEIDGKTILKNKYEKVELLAGSDEKFYKFVENEQIGLVSVSDKTTIPPFCEDLKYEEEFLFVKKNGLWGILLDKVSNINYRWENITLKPEWKIKESSYRTEKFIDCFVVTHNGKQGLLKYDREAKNIINEALACEFDEIDKLSFGENEYVFAVRKGDKWGFPEKKIAVEYDKFFDVYYSDLKILRKNGKYGVINSEYNQEKVPFEYDAIVKSNRYDYNSEELFFVGKNGKNGLYSHTQKKEIIPCEYEGVEIVTWEKSYKEAQVVSVKENGKIRIWQGGKLLEGIYDSAAQLPAYSGYCIVTKGDKKGIVGFENVPCEFDTIKKELKGYTVTQGEKIGYYSNEKLIVPCQYDETKLIELRIIENGKANHFYYVKATDANENIHLYNVTEGKLIAKSNPAVWNDVRLVNSYFLLYKGNKVGLMNNEGKVVVAPKHDEAVVEGNGYIAFANANGADGTLFVYGAQSGKLFEQKKFRASDQYAIRKIITDYGLYTSF